MGLDSISMRGSRASGEKVSIAACRARALFSCKMYMGVHERESHGSKGAPVSGSSW